MLAPRSTSFRSSLLWLRHGGSRGSLLNATAATRTSVHRSFISYASVSSTPTSRTQDLRCAFYEASNIAAKPIPQLNNSSFSTRSLSSFSSPVDWWRGRQEKKEADKYMKRIDDMAEKETWMIGDMKEELDEVVKSWMAKVPGLSDNTETKNAKKMHKTISGVVAVVGTDATEEILDSMSRTEKLKAAIEGESTVEEINILIQQFQTMALMHRVLRKRKLEGKPIPKTAESMQAVLQAEGSKMLSKSQRDRMIDNQKKAMRKSVRRR